MITTAKKIGLPTSRQARTTISVVSPRTLLVAEVAGQFVRGVLDHHHGRVDQDADGDGDARQRHDVAGDAQVVHEDERRSARPAAASRRRRTRCGSA